MDKDDQSLYDLENAENERLRQDVVLQADRMENGPEQNLTNTDIETDETLSNMEQGYQSLGGKKTGGALHNFFQSTKGVLGEAQKKIKRLANTLSTRTDALKYGKGYNNTKRMYKDAHKSIDMHYKTQKKALNKLYKKLKKENTRKRQSMKK